MGSSTAAVNFATEKAQVTYDSGSVTVSTLVDAVRSGGRSRQERGTGARNLQDDSPAHRNRRASPRSASTLRSPASA